MKFSTSTFLFLCMLAFAIPAFATGNGSYSGGSWKGKVQSSASSASGGGAMSSSAVNGSGSAANGSAQASNGAASAGGYVDNSGVSTQTTIRSDANSQAAGFQTGGGVGSSDAGGGTDVNASSSGSFKTRSGGGWSSFGHW